MKMCPYSKQIFLTFSIVALVIVLIVSMTGCQTAGKFDPVKTAKLQATLRPVLSAAVRAEAIAHPQNTPYLAAMGQVFCQMQAGTNFSPAYLVAEVNKLAPPVRNELLSFTRDFLISQYEANYADRLTADLSPEKFPYFLAGLLCQGITLGLSDAPLLAPPSLPVK